MTNKILSWVVLAICEAIIIAAFILFKGNLSNEVMILDIVVCTVILGLFFVDIVRPWADEHTAKLGSMGVRWTVTFLYSIFAVGVMVVLRHQELKIQLLAQSAILVLLLLGIAMCYRTKEQIDSVYKEEQQKLNNRDSIKLAWRNLLEKMDSQPEFPAELRERTSNLLQNMRYLSPTNNPEAMETDGQLLEKASEIGRMVGDFRLNTVEIEQILAKCERLMQRRQTQYSI